MNILFWAISLGAVGTILVILSVLHMHHSLVKEHRIDKKVILSYRQERLLTFIGLIMIVMGYILEVIFYSATPFFHCTGAECAAISIGSLLSQ